MVRGGGKAKPPPPPPSRLEALADPERDAGDVSARAEAATINTLHTFRSTAKELQISTARVRDGAHETSADGASPARAGSRRERGGASVEMMGSSSEQAMLSPGSELKTLANSARASFSCVKALPRARTGAFLEASRL